MEQQRTWTLICRLRQKDAAGLDMVDGNQAHIYIYEFDHEAKEKGKKKKHNMERGVATDLV